MFSTILLGQFIASLGSPYLFIPSYDGSCLAFLQIGYQQVHVFSPPRSIYQTPLQRHLGSSLGPASSFSTLLKRREIIIKEVALIKLSPEFSMAGSLSWETVSFAALKTWLKFILPVHLPKWTLTQSGTTTHIFSFPFHTPHLKHITQLIDHPLGMLLYFSHEEHLWNPISYFPLNSSWITCGPSTTGHQLYWKIRIMVGFKTTLTKTSTLRKWMIWTTAGQKDQY